MTRTIVNMVAIGLMFAAVASSGLALIKAEDQRWRSYAEQNHCREADNYQHAGYTRSVYVCDGGQVFWR